MRWTEDLSTGVAALDQQHQAIFEWLEELEQATEGQRTMLSIYALTRLAHYVDQHFTVEESFMRASDFPRLAEHMAQHAAFRTRIEELRAKAVSHDISLEMLEFLTQWLTDHISVADMEYVPYLWQFKNP